jgi:hypothetical protein
VAIADDPTKSPVVLSDTNATASVLNVPAASLNLSALKTAVAQVTALFAQNKLIPTRVHIFADHPIVKDALADKTIQISITGTAPATLFIPISHRGNRVIVRQGAGSDERFSLYSLPDDASVDLASCVKSP